MTSPEIEAGMSSYPPALLVGSANPNRMRTRVPVGEASLLPDGSQVATATTEQVDEFLGAEPSPLFVDPGTPGVYSPAVTAAQRPRNVTELAERAQPNGRAPWDAGQYVPIGTSGKRAHWTGDRWAGGESPGYTPADTQFPGDGDDTAEDQTR